MTKKNLSVFLLFLKIYALVLSIFSLYRVTLFAVEYNRIGITTVSEVLQAFVMGLRFDIVITGYILILPLFVLATNSLLADVKILTEKIIFYFIFAVFSLSFMICAIEIPYFSQFFSRLSISAFVWLDNPVFVLKMMLQEPRYLIYAILFIFLNILFYFSLKKIFTVGKRTQNTAKLYFSIPLYLLLLGFVFLGIRGRIAEKSPIKVGTAYFGSNPFLNQLGLNANFTLIRSYLDVQENGAIISYMNDSLAIKNVQSYLKIENPSSTDPLLRKITAQNTPKKHNVVLVIMETMSAYYLKRDNLKTGNKKTNNLKNLVPFLDTLSTQGYSFDNCYTAGIHTYNGIFSTLFSYPAIARQHSMKESAMKKYKGLASTLKANDYSTIYFTTHDGQFDNVEGFLRNNEFETVITEKDYPSEKVKTTLGVPDDYMFEFSIPILNQLHQKSKLFLSVFMTASNHGPYYLPDYFTPKTTELKDQIVEFSDWSINKFIDLAKKQAWFDNTIFVFVADHGTFNKSNYEISMDYVHAPLIFYAPSIIKEHKIFDKIAGQIDVFPSIMGLLDISYENNTMGIDLFREDRPYIFFNTHERYGILDKNWLLLLNGDQSVDLLKYRSRDKFNYAAQNPAIVAQMKKYLLSHLQTNQFLHK